MRILSKFKDYYDCSNLQDFDNSCLYVRETKEIKFSDEERDKIKLHHFNLVIGFCGKLYVINTKGNIFLYDDEVKEFEITEKRTYGAYPNTEYFIEPRRAKGKLLSFIKQEYDDLKDNEFLKSLFLKYNVPIFIVKQEWKQAYLTLNAQLKFSEFFKKFNSVQAFQEIEMFISNILVNDKMEVPKRSNEDIGTSKGFDKNSFKNAKKQSKKF